MPLDSVVVFINPQDIRRVQESSGDKIQCCSISEVTNNARFSTSTTTLLKILQLDTEAWSSIVNDSDRA